MRSESRSNGMEGEVDSAESLRQCVFEVVQSYIQNMIQSVELVVQSEGTLDDPLDDEGSIREQMDRFPVIARLQYTPVTDIIISIFDSTFEGYIEFLGSASSGNISQDDETRCMILEGQLIWLVYMISSLLSCSSSSRERRRSSSSHHRSEHSKHGGVSIPQALDANLARRVFELIVALDTQLSNEGHRCDIRLEFAVIAFIRTYRKVYVVDHQLGRNNSTTDHLIPGTSIPHPVLTIKKALDRARGGVRSDSNSMSPGDTSPPNSPRVLMQQLNLQPSFSTSSHDPQAMTTSTSSEEMRSTNNNKKENEEMNIFQIMGFDSIDQSVATLISKLGNNIKYLYDDDVSFL